MKKEDLFAAVGGVDEELLERSEAVSRRNPWRYLAAAAACFVAILGAATIWWKAEPTPMVSDTVPGMDQSQRVEAITVEPAPIWQIYYNYSETDSVVATDVAYLNGYFVEELSQEELAAVLPAGVNFTGYGGFEKDGTLIEVCLYATTPSVTEVTISPEPIARCCVVSGEMVASRCGEVEFYVTYSDTGDGVDWLEAEAKIGAYYYLFSTYGTPSEQLRQDFQALLEAYALAGEKIQLSKVVADGAESWLDEELSQEEARADVDFGAYWPENLPEGFGEGSIRRYRDQNEDYLSGLWTRGHDEFSWQVCYFEEEDEARCTSSADRENYDLALYPIPRAESVPEELWEIVDNPIFELEELTLDVVYARAYQVEDGGDSEGWRMNFSVRCGDMVVEIRTKGVSPEWVYERLMELQAT